MIKEQASSDVKQFRCEKEFTYPIASRGEIVHLPSLIKALEEKKMWGVALDVFEGEKK